MARRLHACYSCTVTAVATTFANVAEILSRQHMHTGLGSEVTPLVMLVAGGHLVERKLWAKGSRPLPAWTVSLLHWHLTWKHQGSVVSAQVWDCGHGMRLDS